MSRKLIRLTESDLHRIVKESVNKLLREGSCTPIDEANTDDANFENWKSTFNIYLSEMIDLVCPLGLILITFLMD